MEHLGDITKLSGYDIPPVDVIVGGSPCQDLSVAGKREGLSGARSGLFMEQVRIVKEMREATNGEKPRFMVWENVVGAFSSGKDANGGKLPGEDFRIVLEETSRIADGNAVVPRPSKGKWSNAGCIMGDGWSIAWRVHDAQFWGVPQRRRRIALVADFGGANAADILFYKISSQCEGMHGNPAACEEEGEEAAGDFRESTQVASGFTNRGFESGDLTETLRSDPHGAYPMVAIISRDGGHVYDGVAGTLRAEPGDNRQAVCFSIGGYNSEGMLSENPKAGIYEADTARTLDNQGGNPACNQGGMAVVCATTEITPKTDDNGVSFSLRSRDYKDPQIVCLEGNGSRPSHQGDGWHDGDPMYTLNATEHHAVCCIPINTMVGTRTTDEKRTAFGIGNEGDPQFTLGANHEHAVCYDARGNGDGYTVPTITGDHENRVTDYTALCVGNGQANQSIGHVVNTISSRDYKGGQCVMYKESSKITYCIGKQDKFAICEEVANTLSSSGVSFVSDYIVRRLTPLECERLQGFPDGWTDIGDWTDSKGKKRKGDADTPRYKALGNSIALPFWDWMAGRMAAYLGGGASMGSLFDGIGGFPLVYMRHGVTPVWASEIDDFCIAVTQKRL